jgi:hypothetical protein
MSCEDCEKSQEGISLESLCYVRIGNGNVVVVGCRKHLKELLQRVSDSHKKQVAECGLCGGLVTFPGA